MQKRPFSNNDVRQAYLKPSPADRHEEAALDLDLLVEPHNDPHNDIETFRDKD